MGGFNTVFLAMIYMYLLLRFMSLKYLSVLHFCMYFFLLLTRAEDYMISETNIGEEEAMVSPDS